MGEREGSLIGTLKTTIISYLFIFLYGLISCPSKAGRRLEVPQVTHFTLGVTEAGEEKAFPEVRLAS